MLKVFHFYNFLNKKKKSFIFDSQDLKIAEFLWNRVYLDKFNNNNINN
jgi:hypothetical protein